MTLSVFNNARVVLTGHTGFKGSWLSLWLTRLGAQVYGVSLDVPTEPSNFQAIDLPSFVEDFRLDIRDQQVVNALVKEISPDFVFHLAAQSLVKYSYIDPILTWNTNLLGTLNLLEALRDIRRPCVAVLITSDKCYENAEWAWGYRENDLLGGADPYSASKAAVELAIRSYVRSFLPASGLIRIAVGRAGNVIGGGDWAANRVVPDCMRAWSRAETVELRNPNATRPWQHVLEPLSGYVALASELHRSASLHGEAFNFGPSAQQVRSVRELVLEISKHWGQVRWEEISHRGDIPHESSLLKLNCDKALHHLNWRSVWEFPQTVRETALWYRQYYESPAISITKLSHEQITLYESAAKAQCLTWAN